jgi:16S rRNA (guanine527-N7)-methyltransferase
MPDGAATGLTLGRLRQRYSLSERSVQQLECLTDLLERDPAAPTAVRERTEVLADHIADSLVALELSGVRDVQRLADIGAGAGLPGLVLAIALPRAAVTLLESVRRKCAFIQSAIDRCELVNARVVWTRAEAWEDGRGCCDLVTARAVAPLNVLAEYAAPLLASGGRLVAWRGRRDPVSERAAAAAAEELGLVVEPPLPVSPYPRAAHRHLHVLRKVRETPPRFPRRPGMARKRPLGE